MGGFSFADTLRRRDDATHPPLIIVSMLVAQTTSPIPAQRSAEAHIGQGSEHSERSGKRQFRRRESK